jgi:hypothetical protein
VANRGDIALRRVELARPQPQRRTSRRKAVSSSMRMSTSAARAEQRGDVLARRAAGVAHGKYLTNLGRGQPRSLSGLHELQTGQGSRPVVAVTRCVPRRLVQDTGLLLEAHGPRGDAGQLRQLTDPQFLLDQIDQQAVYGAVQRIPRAGPAGAPATAPTDG